MDSKGTKPLPLESPRPPEKIKKRAKAPGKSEKPSHSIGENDEEWALDHSDKGRKRPQVSDKTRKEGKESAY